MSITFLRIDLENMIQARKNIEEEKQLELRRLESLAQRNNQSLESNIRDIIELSIKESLRQNSTLSSVEILSIARQTRISLFQEENHILSIANYESMQEQIGDTLRNSLESQESISPENIQELINIVVDDIEELEILSPDGSNNREDDVSFFRNIFALFIPWVSANTGTLSQEQRDILLLKVKIQIESILQKSIQAEIANNTQSIDAREYDMLIEENLIALEELVILQNSLENDIDTISMDDIQRLNL